MKQLRYVENVNVIPVIAPQDIVATAKASEYVDLNFAHRVAFFVQFGNMTSDSTDGATVTLEANAVGDTSSSDNSETTLAFNYRVSSALATNSWGAITAATASGAALTAAAGDNKVMYIDVDPSAVANAGTYRFVRVVVTPNAEAGATLVAATAFVDPRYAGNAIPSSS